MGSRVLVLVLAMFLLCSTCGMAAPDSTRVEDSQEETRGVSPNVLLAVWEVNSESSSKFKGSQDPIKFRRWATLFLITRLADAATTNIGLHQGGRELNPILRGVVQNPAGDYALAVAVGLGLPALIRNTRGYDYHLMESATIVSGIGPLWNLTQIHW